MATHRKKSAKNRIRTGEFAVAAFLGLAVTAAPAIAAADTSDGPSTGPTADKSDSSNTTGVKAGPRTTKSGKTGASTGHAPRAGAPAVADNDSSDDGPVDSGLDDGELESSDPAAETPVIDTDADDDLPQDAGDGGGTETLETPTPPVLTDPAVVDPVVTEPVVIDTPELPASDDGTEVVGTIEVPSSNHSASSLSLRGSTPVPTALASALLDINLDIVPKPPVIPAFAPLMGIINGLASWVDKVFPAYAADPLLSPTQVAAGYVMTLMAGLQTSYWQGQPTPFTFGALVLVTAAYARYERLATNHLPGAPTLSAGPLPLTWKLKSVDPDGDLLVYSVSGQPSNGLITMSPDGTFSFVPSSLGDLNDGTDVTFTVRVNDVLGVLEHPLNPDGNDAFFTVSFRYPGLGINNLPVFNTPGKATVTGTDGNTGKVTIVAEATDADGDPLTYTGSALFGTVTRNEDGTFTYTPSAAARHGAAGLLGIKSDVVSIWANDGRGGITLLPTVVTVTIVGANNAPTVTVKPPAVSDPLTGLIVGGFDIDDDDNDLVTFSPVALTTTRGGIVTVTPLGYTYLPSIQARSQGGTDTFTVTADDGHGGTVDVSITVTVAKFNLGPIGGITTAAPDSDGIVRGQVSATDLNGDTITYTLTGGVSTGRSAGGGIVVLNSNGTFTFIPKPSTDLIPGLTMDSFEVELSDGNGGFATTTVTLFADLKLDPKVTSNAGGVIKGGVDIDDNDNVGLLTYSVGNGPAKGNVTVNADGTYTYTATTAGWNETDTFTIIGTVNGLSITVATVSLVPKPNVAPTSELVDGAVIPIGVGSGIATGNVNAHDENGDTLQYSVTGYGGASSITLSNGSIVTVDSTGKWTYIPGLNSGDLNGLSPIITGSSFTVYITDGKGGQTSTPVIVTTHELDLPITKIVNNGTVTGGLGLTAGEQGLMTYTVGTGPNKGTITVNADGTYTYTGTTVGWNESDSFSIVGHIGGQSITVAQVSVVPKSNAAPSSPLIGGATVIGGSGIATGTVGASDDDGDTLQYSVTGHGGASTKVLSNGAIVTVDANGKWSYIPGLNSGDPVFGAIALSTFTVYVTDGKGGQTSTLITVNTHNLDIPVTTVGSSGTVTGGLSLTAGEQGLMTYKVGTGPGKGNVTVNADGTYTYTATTASWNQSDSFSIIGVVNGVEITVANVSFVPKSNAAPNSPLLDGATVIGGSGIASGNVGATDANGDTLHYSVTGYGGSSSKVLSNGSIVTVDANGKWSYVPGLNSGFLGAIVASSFTVYVSDGKGGETSTLVTVSTHDLDLPVSTTNGGHGVTAGGVQLTSNEQGVLTYSVGTGPTKGTVTINPNGTYTYTRTASGHTGGPTDSFEIVGSVGGVSIVVASVTVNPTLSNAAPTAGTTTITESSLGGDFLGIRTQSGKGKVTAFDADGDAISYPGGSIIPALYGTANGGSVSFYSDGTFTYTITKSNSYFHSAAANGATGLAVADTFTITVTDSLGASSTIVVSVPIEKLNSSPSTSVSVGGKATDALGVVRGNLSGSDGDDDSLTYTLIGGANGTAATANGGIIRFSGNSFTYVPTAGKASDSFQVQVNDGHGGVSTATISLTGLSTPSPTTNVNTSTANVVTGQLNTAGNTGLTYSVGSQGIKGSVTVASTGAFTYTRTVSGHSQTPSDTFTIKATDANGNSVIIATVNVTPTVTNVAPVAGTTVFTGSSIDDNRILGIGTLKQTTTGTLKANDSDGDTVTFTAGSFSTANGGTVVINAGGTFTYTIDEGFSYYHGAAKIGATGSALADTFSATAVDGFGGSTSYSVSVAIYAINNTPTISGGTKLFGSVTGINVDDNDGDSLTFTHNGSGFSFGGRGVYLSTLSSGSRLTVTDGYYVTVNGVVTGTPSTVTKTW